MTESEISNGYGISDVPNRLTTPCADTNCRICSFAYQTCTMCKSATPQYYLYGTTCYLPSSLPVGSGPDLDTLIAMTCPTNCKKCTADRRYCEECTQPGSPPYRYIYDGQCYYPISLPKTWGASPSYIALNCQDPNCEQCQQDYTKCTVCLPNRTPLVYYYAPNNTCLDISYIPVGFEAYKTAVGYVTVRPCLIVNCTRCQNSYDKCE